MCKGKESAEAWHWSCMEARGGMNYRDECNTLTPGSTDNDVVAWVSKTLCRPSSNGLIVKPVIVKAQWSKDSLQAWVVMVYGLESTIPTDIEMPVKPCIWSKWDRECWRFVVLMIVDPYHFRRTGLESLRERRRNNSSSIEPIKGPSMNLRHSKQTEHRTLKPNHPIKNPPLLTGERRDTWGKWTITQSKKQWIN